MRFESALTQQPNPATSQEVPVAPVEQPVVQDSKPSKEVPVTSSI